MANGQGANWQHNLGTITQPTGTKEYNAFRTLYVLLGGTGMKTGMRLRKRVLEAYGVAKLPFQEYLWLDTDLLGDLQTQTIQEDPVMEARLRLETTDMLDISLPYARVEHLRLHPQVAPWLWEWLDPAFLTNLGSNANAIAGAAQIRPLGRLAFEDKFGEFQPLLQRKLSDLFQPQIHTEARSMGFTLDDQGVEVVLVCSLAGGTGSGCFMQVARAVRELSGDQGHEINLTGHLLLPNVFTGIFQGAMLEDIKANAFAALMELNALNTSSGQTPRPFWIGGYKKAQPRSNPFNQVYLIDDQNRGSQRLATPMDADAYDMVADALFLDFDRGAFGTKKRSHRCNMAPHLANTDTVWTPVNDGTQIDGAQSDQGSRRYTFRYPTAFGSYGLARVPFDRRRYARAGAARLGAELLALLINDPDPPPQPAQIHDQLGRNLASYRLRPDDIYKRLLTVGDGTNLLHDDQVLRIKAWFNGQRTAVSQHLSGERIGGAQRRERLNRVAEWGRGIATEVGEKVTEVQRAVDAQLSRSAANPAQHGAHAQQIASLREAVSKQGEDDLRAYLINALATPQFQGLFEVRHALSYLKNAFQLAATLAGSDPPGLDRPNFEISPDPQLQHVMDQAAAAEAIWLPGFRGVAMSYARRMYERETEAAAARVVRQVTGLLNQAELLLIGWVEQRYLQLATADARAIFRHLQGVVGIQGTAADGDTEATQYSGLSLDVQRYEKALEGALNRFRVFEKSYRGENLPTSTRHATDHTPWNVLGSEVQKLIMGTNLLPDGPAWRERLLNLWDQFFTDRGIRPPAIRDGDVSLVLGIKALVNRAMRREEDATLWNDIQDQLEQWTARQTQALGQRLDALSILGSDDAITNALRKAGTGASPYLKLDIAWGPPTGVQPLALLGVQNPGSNAVTSWIQSQRGELSTVQPVLSDGGSAVIYVEIMALPLYYAHALTPLKSAWNVVAARPNDGAFHLQKRHTERAFLDLPEIQPPTNPQVTIEWFMSDRLALEATLLGVFTHRDDSNKRLINYTVTHPTTQVRISHTLPDTLTAIAACLRKDDAVHAAVEREVRFRRNAVWNDEALTQRALALANWTQNVAFPAPPDGTHLLEHDLAASLFASWCIEAAQRQGSTHEIFGTRATQDLDGGMVDKWCPAPTDGLGVGSRALQASVKCLRVLQQPARSPEGRPPERPAGDDVY
jgi:hypothetical protein